MARLLRNSQGPIIAATDYVRAVPESIRAALREFFGVDAASIVRAALSLTNELESH